MGLIYGIGAEVESFYDTEMRRENIVMSEFQFYQIISGRYKAKDKFEISDLRTKTLTPCSLSVSQCRFLSLKSVLQVTKYSIILPNANIIIFKKNY